MDTFSAPEHVGRELDAAGVQHALGSNMSVPEHVGREIDSAGVQQALGANISATFPSRSMLVGSSILLESNTLWGANFPQHLRPGACWSGTRFCWSPTRSGA